jgi:hypothetical protein
MWRKALDLRVQLYLNIWERSAPRWKAFWNRRAQCARWERYKYNARLQQRVLGEIEQKQELVEEQFIRELRGSS